MPNRDKLTMGEIAAMRAAIRDVRNDMDIVKHGATGVLAIKRVATSVQGLAKIIDRLLE